MLSEEETKLRLIQREKNDRRMAPNKMDQDLEGPNTFTPLPEAVVLGPDTMAFVVGVVGSRSLTSTKVVSKRLLKHSAKPWIARRKVVVASWIADSDRDHTKDNDSMNSKVEAPLDWSSLWAMVAVGMTMLPAGWAEAAEEAVKEESALKTLFKTKTLSLVHPVVMFSFLLGAIWTFYLGYQAQQVRKVDAEERKALIKGQFGKRHFETSSVIMALMTFFTFEGMANTYTRTGKLFPGPHLYAGLGLVAIMNIMASLVPAMQKGAGWARDVHFSLAFVVLGLFAWQAQSGLAIVSKLLGWS